MIDLMNRNEIFSMFKREMNNCEVSRLSGKCRKTVIKLRKIYNVATQASTTKNEAIEDLLTTRPKYDARGRSKRKLTKEMTDIIDKALLDNTFKMHVGLRKQLKLVTDMHRDVRKSGHSISYETVADYVREKRAHGTKVIARDGYIKQWYIPGEILEFDWGEVHLFIKGEHSRLYLGTTALCSNGRWGQLFHRQDKLAFMEAHVQAFRYYGGIPGCMVYDNMKTAIKSFLGNEKEPTQTLINLSAYYGFRFRFCNVRSGNEKGHVERSVEVLRRRAFAERYNFNSLEEANEYLLTVCDQINSEDEIRTNYEQERRCLRLHEADMSCFEARDYRVDKLSTFSLLGSHYSVPSDYIRGKVWVKLYSEQVVAYDTSGIEKKEIARHARSHTHAWVLDLKHYLKILVLKPGALKQSVALQQAPENIRLLYDRHFTYESKSFIELLVWAYENGKTYDELCAATIIAEQKGVKQVTQEIIRSVLEGAQSEDGTFNPVGNDQIADYSAQNLSIITTLFKTSSWIH